MKSFILSASILAVFVGLSSCEKHEWDKTKQLYESSHDSHGHGDHSEHGHAGEHDSHGAEADNTHGEHSAEGHSDKDQDHSAQPAH